MEKYNLLTNKFETLREGGPGSGNKGHSGRPGERGGSGEAPIELITITSVTTGKQHKISLPIKMVREYKNIIKEMRAEGTQLNSGKVLALERRRQTLHTALVIEGMKSSGIPNSQWDHGDSNQIRVAIVKFIEESDRDTSNL